MPGVRSLQGGGGAERFFADFFLHYRDRPDARFDLRVLTDDVSLGNLQAVGRELHGRDVLGVRSVLDPLSLLGQIRDVVRLLREERVDLLHVALPSLRYLPALWLLGVTRQRNSMKLCATMTDSVLAHSWDDPVLRRDPDVRRGYRVYRTYFALLRLDGVLSWYRAFEQRAGRIPIRGAPLVRSARYCFVDTQRFRPGSKEQLVVWSGRLVASKRPDLFVEAIAALAGAPGGGMRGWRVEMYGQGPLESMLRARIASARLDGVIRLASSGRMAPVLARAGIYVSTQDYENFTSVAMLEAMAAGCAIVARDVGQTGDFVGPGDNGILVRDACTPAELAQALRGLMFDPARVAQLGASSRRVTTERHCADNFRADIEAFWTDVLARDDGA